MWIRIIFAFFVGAFLGMIITALIVGGGQDGHDY